jgi:hypothetical protein
MPKIRDYEMREELSRVGPIGSVVADLPDSNVPVVLKYIQCDPELFAPQETAPQIVDFLSAACVQQQVSRFSSHWAQIEDLGTFPGGAYFSTTRCRLTIHRLIRAKVPLRAHELFAIADGVIKGLGDLKRLCGRSHGNLTARNILVEPASGLTPMQVFLTDPSGRAEDCTESADLQSLGGILYELITRQTLKRFTSYSIPDSDAWARLGRKGEGWHALVSLFLNFETGEEYLTLDKFAHEIAALAQPRRGRWIGRAGLIAFFILLLTLLAALTVPGLPLQT